MAVAMPEVPDPMAVVYGVIAIFVALVVGIPLSNARSNVVLPLISECPPLFLDNLSGAPLLEHSILYFLGVVIFIGIPGALGVALLVFRSRG